MFPDPTKFDRVLGALRDIIRQEFPLLTYGGLYEYLVTDATDTTIDGRPTDTTIGLPDLVRVLCAGALHGGVSRATIGSIALVEFVEGDPTRPECVGLLGAPVTAGVDAVRELDVGPTGNVALGGAHSSASRLNDVCLVYLDASTALVATGTIGGLAFVGTITPTPTPGVPTPALGLITIASQRVMA